MLQSETFRKSTTTNVLLTMLVNAALEQKELSTVTIGLELFGRKYDPEKSDVNIRVNISHLRKRLGQYYEDEGINDPIVISIEPGKYRAAFALRETASNPTKRKRLVASAVLLMILGASAIYVLSRSKDEVWKPMFQNGLETTLFLGDVFGYNGINQFGNIGWHRDWRINSLEDFYEFIKQDPDRYSDLVPADYSYIVFENAFNIKLFTRFFTLNKVEFGIQPVSISTTRLIQDQNTIYAGPLFVDSFYNQLFNDFSQNVALDYGDSLQNKTHYLYTEDGMEKKVNVRFRSEEGEYAIASAFNGTNNTRHYLFFSNHGMGLTALVQYFTNETTLELFSEKYLEESDEFVALFYVTGKDRTSTSIELVHIDNNQ